MIAFHLAKLTKQKLSDAGEPYPHMYILRKPKPHGMLLWTGATYVVHPSSDNRKLPFFLDIVPHLKPNDDSLDKALRIMMERWRFAMKPHIVADSGFGSFGMLDAITKWEGTATLSMPINECQGLDSLLSYNLPVNNWRACTNDKGFILSAQCKAVDNASGGKSIARKFVLTNAFKCQFEVFGTVNIIENPTVVMPRYDKQALDKLTIKNSTKTLENLEASLTDICLKFNIRKGKTKDDYVKNILNRVQTTYAHTEAVDQVERYVKSEFFEGTSLIHETYVTRFNAVDMGDRWYSAVDEHHKCYDWHTKMLLAIMKLGMVNVWVYHCKVKYSNFVDFRKELAKQML